MGEKRKSFPLHFQNQKIGSVKTWSVKSIPGLDVVRKGRESKWGRKVHPARICVGTASMKDGERQRGKNTKQKNSIKI